MTKHHIGVVGTGTMGRGIIQLLLQAGHDVHFHDTTPGAAAKAADHVLAMLRRALDKGKMSSAEFAATPGRMHACDALAGLANCDIVIEAIVEDLNVKVELFRKLEELLPDSSVLATNTSSLLVSAIAAGCRRPERVAGLHFFNPVPLMKVAEVIPGVRTDASTVAALTALIGETGHRAVIAADQPGFLVNHAGRGLYTEGLRIVEESAASPEEVDTVLRHAAGFRMGPFELLDLTGLDVSGKVMHSIYEQFQHEPRFRPSALVAPRIAAGLFGRKTGRGWYLYEGDKKVENAEHASADWPAGLRVWLDPAADDNAAMAQLLTTGAVHTGAVHTGAVQLVEQPAQADLLVVQCWGSDASSYCAAHGLDATRCVAIDPLPGFARHRTLMLTATTRAESRDTAAALFASDGTGVTVINDSCGFIVQRVLAMIVNIACDIAQRRIASVTDIEDAVTLGLGYPYGPLTWGDRIGPARVLQILAGLQSSTGEHRYRPSPWLRRRAALGVSLLSPEPVR
jgi:3-hydroxybutyryl-CoA dehydrogenase